MPNEIQLLVVEDNAEDLGAWERAVERHNATADDSASTVQLVTASSLEAAEKILATSQLHAAVIDLRLDGNGKDPDENAGNDVLASVLSRELAVAAIFTGQPTDARVPAYAKTQVRVFTKGGDESEGISAVMAWLVAQFPLINCIQDATLVIRREMASVFNHSIWPRWKLWMDIPDPNEKKFLSASVARHIVSHVYEGISDSLAGRAHAEEWYLLPPNPSGFRTGDLVRHRDGQLEIVVTPRCDIATQKFQTIQLARCEDISSEWDSIKRQVKAAEERVEELKAAKDAGFKDAQDQLGKLKGKFNALIRHDNNKSDVHFLPRMKISETHSIGPLHVHFDQLRSVMKTNEEFAEMQANWRIATLSPAFLPSLVERLGSFFSRIGSPDYCHIDDADDAICAV